MLYCRGDAAPSTLTDKSKPVSDEIHLAQAQGARPGQAVQPSAAPAVLPFAFQHWSPGLQRPLAEQSTPVLPHKQQLAPAEGTLTDRTRLEVGVQPDTRANSYSHSKHSRSSSEERRGARLQASLSGAIPRSATAPPQLLLESQRGSNSPKKPPPKCHTEQSTRS